MNRHLLHLYHHLPAPARSAAATLYGLRLRWWRHGRARERLVREARERDSWSAAQWQRWKEERLGRQLERAATRVPYYREYWQKRRRAGDRASWELLENWPILEKATLQAQPRAFLADDGIPGQLFELHTSGTTGTPLPIWRGPHTVEGLYAIGEVRTRGWHGVREGTRWARLGGRLVVPQAQRRPPFWVWNAAMRQLYLSTYHLADDLIPHYLDALRAYGIRYLAGYTSSLGLLAHAALERGRDDLRMLVTITNGEPLGANQRSTIGAAFGIVRETYGMAESVAWGSECEAGHLHLWPEVGTVETIDGEWICTGLLNAEMPLIRYRVGDRGQLAPPDATCPCGRHLPLVETLEGRSSDSLITRDGRRVFWLNPVWYGIPVREAQIIQESLDQVRVAYVPGPTFTSATAHEVIERLHERLGDMAVVLEEVRAVPRLASGKLRAVVCKLSPAEQALSTGVGTEPA